MARTPDIMSGFTYKTRHSNNLAGHELGMILFKPDATGNPHLCEEIIEYIIDCLGRNGLPLVMHSMGLQKIYPEHIPLIYPEERVTQYLRIISRYLCSGLVMPIVIAHPDASNALNAIKGSVRTGEGIRGTFLPHKPISIDDLTRWRSGCFSREDTDYIGNQLLAANLVHVPDNESQAWMIARLLCSRHEVKTMFDMCRLNDVLPRTV